ncbi:MAG: ACT domain-containing protein [Candidatus Acidiferrales bacterium]
MPTFVVHARRTPQVLGRLVSLFYRRAIEITRLSAKRTNDTNVLRVMITVESDADQSRLIEANLYKLMDLLLVEKRTSCGWASSDDAPK